MTDDAQPQQRHAQKTRLQRFFGDKKKVIWFSAAALVVILLAAGIWVGVRAIQAKNALESAQTLVSDIQNKVKAQDFEGAVADAEKLESETAIAANRTSDPVWRAFEFIPVLGSNLTGVRQIAEVVDEIATGAVNPLMGVAGGGLDSFKPVDGRLDIDLIRKVSGAVAQADDALTAASTKLNAIDTSSTVSVVTDAKAKLVPMLGEITVVASEARKVTDVLPAMLGGDEARQYIMLFQNNAESTSLGGNTAAWVILNVDNGAISIGEQPNSLDFDRNRPAPLDLDPAIYSTFESGLFRYATNITIRPDFPSSAQMAQAFWQRESGVAVDGVIAFDPIALGYLLDATGPLTLPTGQELNSANAVQLLLADVYGIYPIPYEQDEFFAGAAAAVFGALTSTSPDVPKLIDALTRAADDNRLLVWSTRPEEQALIVGTPLEGALAKDNAEETEMGAFFIENSASKMSFYLKTAATFSSTQCTAPDAPAFSAKVALRSEITRDQYLALPAYVKSQVYKNPIKTRTLVYVYGPVGATFDTWSWDNAGLKAELVTSSVDMGRPVAQIAVELRPGDRAEVTASFTAAAGEYGPLTSRVTPMVNPTAVTLDSPGC